jgi:PAS domain S-box-containing protein
VGTSLAAESLLSLAVAVTSEQRVESVLQNIVQGLASQPGVALARIWLLPSVRHPSLYGAASDLSDCLYLVASAGNPINSPGEDWCFLQGHFARMPFNVGKVGQVAVSQHPVLVEDVSVQNDWIVRSDWAKREEIRSFAGHPLIFREKLLGVIAVFSRQPLVQQEFTWLGLFANQAALAIASAALHERKLEAHSLLDSMPGFLACLSPDGTPEIFNRPFLQYLGRTVEEIGKWSVSDIVHVDDLAHTIEVFGNAISTGEPCEFEYRLRRFDGVYRWFQARMVPVRNAEGRIINWNCLVTDIDDRKKAEEALSRARSELVHMAQLTTLNTLTASIAHEINQPLSGIITNASTCLRILDGDPPNVEGARETVRRTIRDGNRASDVITRLRALYTKKEFTLEPLDLNAVTQEVIALSLSDLRRNQVLVRSELADGLPLVNGDRVQLQQVILNLMRNAYEAMVSVENRPRELLIRTEPEEADCVRLSVKDVGHGFTPDAAAKLFQAFYTTKNNGMGIGLHVSQSIIEAHHGRLWATANDGPGATFSFAIPCRAMAWIR